MNKIQKKKRDAQRHEQDKAKAQRRISALLLHESMTPLQLFGAVLIIGGAMFGELRRRDEGR